MTLPSVVVFFLPKVPKVPKLVHSAHDLLCSMDSTRLFVASDRGSVHVLKLLQSGACKHLHTLCPDTGDEHLDPSWDMLLTLLGQAGDTQSLCSNVWCETFHRCLCPSGLMKTPVWASRMHCALACPFQ